MSFRSMTLSILSLFLLVATVWGQLREPGTIPYDFPIVETTTAAAGEFVLAPGPEMLQNAVERNGDATLIWYVRTYVGVNETSPGESILESPFDTFSMPNSLIIPLGPGTDEVEEGDILLSWWQSGSGMQRCYVVDATDPARPGVKYLDIDLDNPATNSEGIGIGRQTEQLEAGTFSVLSDATVDFAPGSAAACRVRGTTDVEYGLVISTAQDKVLTLGFAGRVSSYPLEGCTSIPIKGSYSPGDVVFAPSFSTMREAEVVSFSEEFGRYFVVFFSEEEPIPIGDVLAELPNTLEPTTSPSTAPSETDNGDDFPEACIGDRDALQVCTRASLTANEEQLCIDCWVEALPDSPDGCDDGRTKFCEAFDCNECGVCRGAVLTLTNCLVEEAQACGFADPICTDEAPSLPPDVVATSDSPSMAPEIDFPEACIGDLNAVQDCTDANLIINAADTCIDCWVESLPDSPDGCDDGREKFCTAFECPECGVCRDTLLMLTNCLVEEAQSCGFADPICTDATPSPTPDTITSSSPSTAPSFISSSSPSTSPTGGGAGVDTSDIPEDCIEDFLNATLCTAGLQLIGGEEVGNACVDCWVDALPDNPDDCEDGREKFCAAFVCEVCGDCKDAFSALTNCIVEDAQGCKFEDPICLEDDQGSTSAGGSFVPSSLSVKFVILTAAFFFV